MRKLVLSGFLASEEIYINQLEALLLVSIYALACWSVSRSKTPFGVGEEGRPGPVLPCGQNLYCSADHLALGRGHCRKGACASQPQPSMSCPGKGGRSTARLEMANTPMAHDHAQAFLISDSTLSRWESGWGPSLRLHTGLWAVSTSQSS